MDQPNDHRPLPLRGHTLLCLQGFRGEGYSQAFIENLAAVHRSLAEHPDQLVQVVEEPDTVCAACPHRSGSGCTLNGETSESAMREQDRDVLERLGLRPGALVSWGEILDRIRVSLTGESLPTICGNCRWLPLGYCREGIDSLRAVPSGPVDRLISIDAPVRSPSS